MENYLLHLFVMIGIYLILAYSMNLVTGFGGLITFCHATFYGMGAYTYAMLRIGIQVGSQAGELLFSRSWSFLPALAGAAVAGALLALLVGWFSLRFRGDYFVFATIGFQMIVFVIIYNWTGFGRGAIGIYGIPRPDIWGWQIKDLWQYSLLVAGINVIVLPALFLLYRSPFGLSLKGLREDERAAESLGISSFRQHLSAIVLAGAYAGLAGALFASYVTYIDPTSFSLRESIFLVTLLLLGGSGNLIGPLCGVLVMMLLPEGLRFVGLPDSIAPNVREILYGIILVVLMYLRPKGLAGEHAVQ